MNLLRGSAVPIVIMACMSIARTAPITIDFDDLAEGIVVTDQYISSGVTISLVGGTSAGPITKFVGPLTFTDGNAVLPGSDVLGPLFDIVITFDQPVDYFSIIALDAEPFESFSLVATLAGVNVPAQFSSTELVGSEFGGPTVLAELGEIGSAELFDSVLIDLTNGTGIPPGPEYWDNLTFNKLLDTEGDGDPDVTDPDDDNDGIGDALDTQPLIPSNLCTESDGDNATLGISVVDDLTCAARVSIDVQPWTQVLGPDGHLHLIAPAIVFQPGFRISEGGRLTAVSADPCPGCSPQSSDE